MLFRSDNAIAVSLGLLPHGARLPARTVPTYMPAPAVVREQPAAAASIAPATPLTPAVAAHVVMPNEGEGGSVVG